MKQKHAYHYLASDFKKSLLAFYIVIIIVIAINVIHPFFVNVSDNASVYIAGMETASFIFLFVIGICSFSEAFAMFVQNGISRKSGFFAWLIFAASASAIVAFIDSIIWRLTAITAYFNPSFHYSSLFSSIFTTENSLYVQIIENFFFNMFSNLISLCVGYFIGVAYYRMETRLKIAVSIGVPCLIIFGPIIDASYNNGRILNVLYNFFFAVSGFKSNNPWIMFATLLILSCLISYFSWLLHRRAIVKE